LNIINDILKVMRHELTYTPGDIEAMLHRGFEIIEKAMEMMAANGFLDEVGVKKYKLPRMKDAA